MTGVVADVGDGATHIVLVADGYVIENNIKSIPIARKDVKWRVEGGHFRNWMTYLDNIQLLICTFGFYL